MSEMEAELLMKLTLEGVTLRDVGATPRGERQFVTIGGGRFEGRTSEDLATTGLLAVARPAPARA